MQGQVAYVEVVMQKVGTRRAACVLTAVLLAMLVQPLAAYACTANLAVSTAGGADPLPTDGPPAGTSLTLSGSDFMPGEVVLRWGTSTGQVIGEVVADDRGEFTTDVQVPDEPSVPQRIVATNTVAGEMGAPTVGWVNLATPGAAATTAAEVSTDRLGSPMIVAVALTMVLAIAAVVVVLSRRRRRQRECDLQVGQAEGVLAGTFDDLHREYVELIAAQEDEQPAGTWS